MVNGACFEVVRRLCSIGARICVLLECACGGGSTINEASSTDAEDHTVSTSDVTNSEVSSFEEMSSGGEECSIEFEPFGERRCGTVAGRTLCYLETRPRDLIGSGNLGHIADVNKDGRQDLLIQESNPGRTWLLQSRAECGQYGGFVEAEVFSMNTPILLSIKTVDANEDNIKDVMLRTFSDSTERTTKLFLGNERFEFSGMFVPEISAGEIDVVSDIDGDGHADIIGRDGENVMVYLGDGVGGFTVGPIIELGGTASAQVAVVDFDKDGRSDIVAVRKVPINDFDSFFEVVVLFGDEEYLYSSRLIHALDVASYQPRDIVVGDFNQDEMPDFAVHEAVFYGGGADILSIESHPELIANISAADVDGDGLTDLISSLDVYINTGSGFVGGFGGIDFPTEIRPGEFDGDGLTDLAAIKYGPGDVEDSVVIYTRVVD